MPDAHGAPPVARRDLSRVTLLSGSAHGNSPVFAQETARLARELAEAGIGIAYGGGRVGLMGTLADAALEAGGEVLGVMPQPLVDDEMTAAGFLAERQRASLVIASEPEQLISELSSWVAPPAKWERPDTGTTSATAPEERRAVR